MPDVVMLSEVEALSLDLWSTLIRSHPEFKPARTAMLARAFGIAEAALEETDAVFRSADRAADDDAEALGRDVGFVERALAMFNAAQAAGLTTLPAPGPTELRRLEAGQAELVSRFPPQPYSAGVVELLLALGDLLPLAVTSNTGMLGGATMRRALAASGLLPAFRVLLFSNEMGSAKPSGVLFDATLRGLRAVTPTPLPAASVLHVGDNLVADIQGATDAGMLAQLVNVEGAPPIESVLRELLSAVHARPAAAPGSASLLAAASLAPERPVS